MTITINGNGTVTGVSVGGLPDGIVDAGTLASNSVETAKIAAGAVTAPKRGAGAILQVKIAALGSALNASPTSWTDIGLSETITLASTSNKVLISVSMSPYLDGGSEQRFGMRILVTPSGGSSTVAIQDDYWCYRTDGDWKATADHHQALYSPSSTAALTVKAEYIRYGGNSDNVQMFSTATSTNTLLLQEVAG